MHDFYYSKLLKDPTKFHPRDGNKYVEFVVKPDGTADCLEDDIDEVEIPRWLGNSVSESEPAQPLDQVRKASLRLLIGSPEEHHSDAKILPLPISSSTFEVIRTAWYLPTELLRMMLSSLPLVVPFTTSDGSGKPLQGLMLRGGRSRDWNFCLALVHDATSGTTHGIVNGMQEHEIQQLLSCLKQSTEHICDPVLLPIFLLELKVHYFAILLEKRAIGIEEIEYATGMRHGFSSDPRRNAKIDQDSRERLTKLDFHPIMQKLTGVTGTLSFCDMTFKSSRKALGVVKSFRSRLQEDLKQTSKEKTVNGAIGRRVEYLQELISGSQALGEVLSTRTKAQVQTVYSLIGQRDNKLNIETAAASREIAATSLLHNAAMKDIAEDSRRVAILTRKDSTDMRIIAAVTLVFLPGTFVAAVFGTNFFRFIPDGTDQVVSSWIWLYLVLTVGITVVVLGGWWQFSKKQRMSADLEKRHEASGRLNTRLGSVLEKHASEILGPQMARLGLDRSRSQSTGSVTDIDPYGVFAPTQRHPSGQAVEVL